MTMQKLYQHLSLPVSIVNDTFDTEKYSNQTHSVLAKIDINYKFLEFIDTFGLSLDFAEVFYCKPFYKLNAHVDNNISDFPKINWVFGGKNSKMIWYKSSDGFRGIPKTTGLNTPYSLYPFNTITPIEDVELVSPSIVQAAVIHNLETFEEPLVCISTVYCFKGTKTFPMFNQLLEIFKEYDTDISTIK